MPATRKSIMAISMLAMLVWTAGCASPAPSRPVSTPRAGAPTPKASTPQPGFEGLGYGRAVAFGWLTEVDLHGGQWQLVSQSAEKSTGYRVIAVLVPGDVSYAQLDGLRGTFFGAEGSLSAETTSVSSPLTATAPMITVDAVRLR